MKDSRKYFKENYSENLFTIFENVTKYLICHKFFTKTNFSLTLLSFQAFGGIVKQN